MLARPVLPASCCGMLSWHVDWAIHRQHHMQAAAGRMQLRRGDCTKGLGHAPTQYMPAVLYMHVALCRCDLAMCLYEMGGCSRSSSSKWSMAEPEPRYVCHLGPCRGAQHQLTVLVPAPAARQHFHVLGSNALGCAEAGKDVHRTSRPHAFNETTHRASSRWTVWRSARGAAGAAASSS